MKNKKILIIGGTGALGKTLISMYNDCSDLMVFSRDEHKQVNLEKEYSDIHFQIGDVKDKDSIMKAINTYKPEIIINTAALKHVPVCETNPLESVQVNILGHQNLLDAVSVSNHQVESLIFISTDKACKPINVYGMCKAISEKIYMNFSKTTDIKTVLVRYGNVLESTGSVIPYFKSLLDKKCDYLPITDLNMTRFLLSLEQATDLIRWAYEHSDSHGKIAIPKIKSMRIVDIAYALIDHYSLDVELKHVGIRDGEKLHEELISLEESAFTDYTQKNYLIGSHRINEDVHSFNSEQSLMTKSEVLPFLKSNGVI